MNQPSLPFHGATYSPELDKARLTTQFNRVFALMSDGAWHTLRQIAEAAHGSEAGCSARLRDLRKLGYTVERKRKDPAEAGIWLYRMVV